MARRKKKTVFKNYKVYIGVLLIVIALIVELFIYNIPCKLNDFNTRGIWLSYIELKDLNYSNEKSFEKDFNKVIENTKRNHFNTIYVHVRPFSDALYYSDIYPQSITITKNKLSFDPLKKMCSLCKKNDLKIIAWINPYRVSNNNETYKNFVYNNKRYNTLKNSIITYDTNKVILDPQNRISIDYIKSGIKEIINHYKVNGIIFDDYFYISGTHQKTTAKQRRDAVNTMVKEVYSLIKKTNKDLTFGISPAGNYENCMNDGADVKRWLKEKGYVDYVMPQIYWSNQHGNKGNKKLFNQRAKQFSKLKRHKEVELYAAMALYQCGKELSYDIGWKKSTLNFTTQIQSLSKKNYSGYSMFSYKYLFTDGGKIEMKNLIEGHT